MIYWLTGAGWIILADCVTPWANGCLVGAVAAVAECTPGLYRYSTYPTPATTAAATPAAAAAAAGGGGGGGGTVVPVSAPINHLTEASVVRAAGEIGVREQFPSPNGRRFSNLNAQYVFRHAPPLPHPASHTSTLVPVPKYRWQCLFLL